MGIENLSVHEIQQQLEELAQNRTNLEQALVQRHQQARLDLVQEVKDLIEERGFEVADIASLLGPRRKRAVGTRMGSLRQYTKYVDPDNPKNIYVRGVLPGWMKEKMRAHNYDPDSKEDRDTFKANHLRVMED